MMDDLINRQLGQYRLTEVIRRGGMSTVYKAYQESLDRYVAVKVLFHGQDPQFVARFQREARAIAHLQHPNILPIFDYGEQDGVLYLVLQYIEQGLTLGDLLGQPMAPVPALQLMSRVLAALDYAHERGIVHRDVKPANILMPTPSWPMLSDFGIVKLLAESENPNLTAQGMIVGTPAYLAPEQVLGMHIDRRTDLYSAGIVLYEMVTGRVPFDTGTPIVVATKQAYEPPPPPLTFNPDLPKAIELVVLRALEKDPANRYQTAAEMAAVLERVAQQIERTQAPLPALSHPAAEATDEDLDEQYVAGIAAFEAGNWDQAVRRLRQVVAADPTYADAATMLEAAQEARVLQAEPPPPIPHLPAPPPIAAAPPPTPPGVLAAQAGPPMPAPVASAPAQAAEATGAEMPATPTTTTSTATRRPRQRRPTPPPGEITAAPLSAQSTASASEPSQATTPAPSAAAPVSGAATAPAAPASTTTAVRRSRRRAASAGPPAAVETDPQAAATPPPAEAAKTAPKTGTARRSSKTAADTATPAPMSATALPAVAALRATPTAPSFAAATPPPQARELEAGAVPMSAAGSAVAASTAAPAPREVSTPAGPPVAAPPLAASAAPDSRPLTQRRSPVPFIAIGAGVLLLILAAIFGPGLLAAGTGTVGSPTPVATAPATTAAAPSATSGLPIGAATGSETPGAASPTPAQVAVVSPTVAATEPSTPAPATAAPATAAPTDAAPTAMSMPTPPAIPPTTSQGALGAVRFTDDGQHVVDQLVVTMTLSTLPAQPTGQGLVAWLVNSATGASVNLGRITPDAKGAWTQTFTDTQHANLLASYDGLLVTNEALETTPFAPSSDVVLRGQLPLQALVHLQHLLVSYPDTPNQVGLEAGLRAQVNALITHAQLLSTAQAKGDLATVKQEAEVIANLIEGAKATNFGDRNKDGLIQTAGDGFGLLQNGTQDGYLLGVKDHAELSAAAADATDNVKQHAEGVAITTDNVQVWATQIRDKALAIIGATTTAATRPLTGDILGLATAVEQGQSIGTDGNIRPVKGSGGAITSYQEALLMATIPLQPGK